MTPSPEEKLAEEILIVMRDWYKTSHQYKVPKKKLAELIVSALQSYGDQRAREAEIEMREAVTQQAKDQFIVGYNQAIEEAAKVMEPKIFTENDNSIVPIGLGLASEIRALRKPEDNQTERKSNEK